MNPIKLLLIFISTLSPTLAFPTPQELIPAELVARIVEFVQAPPSCDYVAASTQGQDADCGYSGLLHIPEYQGTNFTSDNVNDCRSACLNSTDVCQSFSYNPKNNECQLYKKLLARMGYKKTSSGTRQFYNHQCFFIYECQEPHTCNNQGIQYAVYPLDPSGQNSPSYYKTATPYYNATYPGIGGFSGTADTAGTTVGTLYGSNHTFSETQFAVNHRGYFYAAYDGPYTFSSANPDDTVHLWVGPYAFAGWEADNADLSLAFSFDGDSGAKTFQFEAGLYYPFRAVFTQEGGPFNYEIEVRNPYGMVVASTAERRASGAIVQFSCDGAMAPQFAPFGQES